MLLIVGLLVELAAAQLCTIRLDRTPLVHPSRMREFSALLAQGREHEARRCCVACLVDKGTPVVITSGGIFSQTVRVLEGPQRDCRGDLPTELLECR